MAKSEASRRSGAPYPLMSTRLLALLLASALVGTLVGVLVTLSADTNAAGSVLAGLAAAATAFDRLASWTGE